MKIAIFGAGAAGLWLGVELRKLGLETTVFNYTQGPQFTASRSAQARVHRGDMYAMLPHEYFFPQEMAKSLHISSARFEQYLTKSVPRAITSTSTLYLFEDEERLQAAEFRLRSAQLGDFQVISDVRNNDNISRILFKRKKYCIKTNEMSFDQAEVLKALLAEFQSSDGKYVDTAHGAEVFIKDTSPLAAHTRHFDKVIFCGGSNNNRIASALIKTNLENRTSYFLIARSRTITPSCVYSARIGKSHLPHLSMTPQAGCGFTISSGVELTNTQHEEHPMPNHQSPEQELFLESANRFFEGLNLKAESVDFALVKKGGEYFQSAARENGLAISHDPRRYGQRHFGWVTVECDPRFLFFSIGKWTLAPLACLLFAKELQALAEAG